MVLMSALLGRESVLVQEFIDVLLAEQEFLKAGDVASLEAITAKKTGLAAKLNAADQERSRLLREAGLSNDKSGIRRWLARHPSDRAVAAEWAKLMRLANQAQEMNNLNGQLISMRMQATHQALAALTWQPQRSTLYSRDGHSAPKAGNRIIDAA